MASGYQVKIPNQIDKWLKQPKVKRSLWVATFFLLMLAALAIHFIPDRTTWEKGQVSPVDIHSNRYITFPDEEATKQKQEEALSEFQNIYSVDLEKFNNTTIRDVSNFFGTLEDVLFGKEKLDDSGKIARLEEALKLQFTAEEWDEVLSMTLVQLNDLQKDALDIVTNIMSKGVSSDNLTTAKATILDEANALPGINEVSKSLMTSALVQAQYQPTYVYDHDATEQKREEVLSEVEPIKVVVQKGERVVSKGEVLTQKQINILTMLGHQSDASPNLVLAGLILLLGISFYLGYLYLKFFCPKILENNKQLVLLMLLFLVTIIGYKVIISIDISANAERSEQVGHMIPVAMGTMLIAVLLDNKLAIFMNFVFAIFVGMFTGQIPFMITALVSGFVGVIGVSHLSRRSDLSKTGLWISIINVLLILSIGIINNVAADILLTACVFGVLNGLLSSILTIGFLPYLETIFGITTPVSLLELSNPNEPLLKSLMMEAPGTYHHSILVGNLGEAAAEAIGANGLLVRIGAYYHDIGKVKRPYFFVENQLSGENPHDKISPSLSTLIITSHVKDGVEMAVNGKIPQVVVDLIAQHHGDSLVKFFYYKAKEADKEGVIKEKDFRYDQLKPQTKEAAVLMLADSVEAAARSMKDATPGQMEGLIRNIIKDKLNDGQFDECDLTFKELDKVAVAFSRVINGIYHKRIEYPDKNSMLKGKKESKNASNNRQSSRDHRNTGALGK